MGNNPLESLGAEVSELVESFSPQPLAGTLEAGLTQYTFWFMLALLVVAGVLFTFVHQQKKHLVPQGLFVNLIEYLVEFTRDSMCKSLIGETWKKHFPFIASLFLVVLVNNIIGIIPGMKPGTGTISTTAALAVCSFVYFLVCGIKKHGTWGYIKSLAPSGVAFPLSILIWLIELLSTMLRLVTLAVRLFCNLFAGHVVMGTFAILASLFFEPLIHSLSLLNVGFASASVLWTAILFMIYAVEILVAAIQAYVFALLSAVYIQIAESSHE